jgi:O-antigen/teichoic acid export membrane protein
MISRTPLRFDLQAFLNRILPLNPFARGVAILAGGTALGQAIAVLSYPVLTRLYRVEDFGYLQIYSSILSFAIVVVTLRFEFAILLPPDEQTAANLVGAALACVAAMTGITAVAIVVAARMTTLVGRAEGLRPYLWFMPVSLLSAGVYQVFLFWALRQKRYRDVSETRLIQAAAQVGTQLAAGTLHPSLFGLLLGEALGRSSGGFRLARQAWRASGEALRRIRPDLMRSAVRRYKDFPLVSACSALINTAGSSVPILAIAALYGPRVIGMVALVTRVLDVPSTLIGQAVSQVFSTEAAKLANHAPHGLYALFLATLRRLASIGALPYLLMMPAAPWAFATIFGATWREAGVYATILLPMQFVAFVVWPLMPTLNVLERQGWQFGWDAGRLTLTFAGIWTAHHIGCSARTAVAIYSATMMLGYMAHAFLSRAAIRALIERGDAGIPRSAAPVAGT